MQISREHCSVLEHAGSLHQRGHSGVDGNHLTRKRREQEGYGGQRTEILGCYFTLHNLRITREDAGRLDTEDMVVLMATT